MEQQQPFLMTTTASCSKPTNSNTNQQQQQQLVGLQQHRNHSPFSLLNPSESNFDLPVQPHPDHTHHHHQEDLRVNPITPPENNDLNTPSKRKQSRQQDNDPASLQGINLHQIAPTPSQLRKLTSEKRKAQNRAAQRNFRERKEKQCKKNEENLIIRTEENKKMRELIESLEAENEFLRQHVTESVLEEVRKRFRGRRRLSSIVGPISAYDEFLSPEKGIDQESEEHTRAATALSSLASGPIDSVFDPQLQELGVSNHSLSNNNNNNSTLDLIVPDHSSGFDHHLHVINKPSDLTASNPSSTNPSNLINSKLFLQDQHQLNPNLMLENGHQNNS